jgi:hypothetical protein
MTREHVPRVEGDGEQLERFHSFRDLPSENDMTTTSSSKDPGRARRLLVTVVVATAAAAVTAGVVLKKHRATEGAQRIDARAALVSAIAAPATPSWTRRIESRDGSEGTAARPESPATAIANAPDSGTTGSDPSLPSAAGVLEHAFGPPDEPSTF